MPEAVTTEAITPAAAPSPAPQNAVRRRLFTIFGLVGAVLAIIFLVWWLFFSGLSETTDDAYVGGDIAAITPLVSGAVKEVRASDTQQVHQGDALVVIDDSDAQVAVAQAEAELQRVARKVRGYVATDTGLQAQEAARHADTERAKAQAEQARSALEKAQSDLTRRTSIAADGAVSGEEVANARTAVVSARANYAASVATYEEARANQQVAAGSLATNHALVAGTSVDTNPEVNAARAKLNQAQLDLARTTLRAPFDGVVARRQVQVGQRVQAGTTLMSVVPVDKLYVDANFKEDQLRKIKVGQSVTLTSDRYDSSVVFHGKVIGFAGGTGAAFALIPAQNATGNWIKVVQRVPIRIALDPAELRAHPLLVGLSMTAKVKFN